MDTQKQQIVNLDTKSQLAKLIATENIEVQHNKVRTASFDTLNRILTLPLFKQQSGDVYDMLIAHECAHALWTPSDGWKEIADDKELRSYVNVLEDCRIDRMIQKKYPGVVKNYINGFDVLEKQNKGTSNEIQLTDAIASRIGKSNCVGYKFSEDRFDCGSKLGFIQANIRFSIERPEMKQKLKNWLKCEIVSDVNV